MDNFYIKNKSLLFKISFLVGFFAFIYLLITFLLPFFAPFVIAILIALINEPVIGLLEKRLKMPRKFASVVSLLFTLSLLGISLTFGVIKIYNELVILQNNISIYIDSVSDQLTSYVNMITAYYNNLPADVVSTIDLNIKSLAPKLEGIVTSIAKYLLNTITSIPKMTVFLIVTLLSTYFISSDRREIRSFLYKQLPASWTKNLSGIKSDTFTALLGYIKAVLILVGFTFAEVSTGLFILHVDYALLLGLLVAISDIIPIVGTGLVMAPWIVWTFITGNTQMALGLTIIYVLGIIIRQVMEPKILGTQIGLHPLVTLITMYIGLEIFGVIGMVIGPVSIIILKNLLFNYPRKKIISIQIS